MTIQFSDVTKKLSLLTLAFVMAGGLFVAGCDNDGPLEDAGEEMDDALDTQ